MEHLIRLFDSGDYEGIVQVFNAVYPEQPRSVDDYRHTDNTCEEKIKWSRWVCEEGGRIIGFGGFSGMTWMYHPRKFFGYLTVHPEMENRGIGDLLHETILAGLQPHDPLSLRMYVKENRPGSISFAEKRGYVAGMREQESILDLTTFEPERFSKVFGQVEEEGIRIVNFTDLAEDPDRLQKYWELDGIISVDMPSPEPLTQPGFEDFCRKVFEHRKFFPEGNLIAMDDDAYIGQSNLWHTSLDGVLDTGFTGVMRDYRGLGIATALKVAVLARAGEMGYRKVITSNDSTNAGMLGINQRLGFQPRPAWIDYEKVFVDGVSSRTDDENSGNTEQPGNTTRGGGS
jgi:mycothiol synthase